MPLTPDIAVSPDQSLAANREGPGSLQPEPAHRGRRWAPASQLRLLAVFTIVIWAIPFVHLIAMQEVNTVAHVAFAREMSETGVLFPGHFLFHLSTIAIHSLAPVSWDVANVMTLLAYRLLLAGIVWSLVRRAIRSRDLVSDGALSIVLTISLLFAGAVSFLTWPTGNYYLGYLVPNIYVSHTLVVLQPLALLSFLAVIRVFCTGATVWNARDLVGLATLSLFSVLAKPSYAMVLVPALVVLLSWRGHLPSIAITAKNGGFIAWRWPQSHTPLAILVVSVIIPTVVAITWVYLSTYLVVQQEAANTGTGISVAPLRVMLFLQTTFGSPDAAIPWLVLKLLLSLLFPLAVAGAYFSTVRADPRFVLAWLQMGVGCLFTYFLAESPNFRPANYTWSGQIAISVLFVISALLLFERTLVSGSNRWRTILASPPAIVCYFALLLHIIGGLGIYLHPEVT